MKLKDKNGKALDIIQTIAAGQYTIFGIHLLGDDNGKSVELIKTNHRGAEEVTEIILRQWLDNGGPNCTYTHLIDSLRAAKFGSLADDVAKVAKNKRQGKLLNNNFFFADFKFLLYSYNYITNYCIIIL